MDGRQISSDLFSVLEVPLLEGRSFTPTEDVRGGPAVAIISSRLSQRRFGADGSAIGKTLTYEGKQRGWRCAAWLSVRRDHRCDDAAGASYRAARCAIAGAFPSMSSARLIGSNVGQRAVRIVDDGQRLAKNNIPIPMTASPSLLSCNKS